MSRSIGSLAASLILAVVACLALRSIKTATEALGSVISTQQIASADR